jgi:uncharacterized protein
MKRAFIVHCWEGAPELNWYPSVKKELEALGYEVTVPAFPDPPMMASWVPQLSVAIGEPDEETILIGHSIGCATILRYLETQPDHEKFGKVILVAGFTDDMGHPELKNFFPRPYDWAELKKHAAQYIYMYSDNDPEVEPKYADEFAVRLGAKKVLVPGRGHFDKDDMAKDLPEVVGEIKD